MIEWFPIIAVGVLLLGFIVGGMMNIFVLTQKEQTNHITLEFGLAPRSSASYYRNSTLLQDWLA